VYIVNNNSVKFEFYQFEKLFFGNESFANNNFFALLDCYEVENLFVSFLETNPLKNDELDKLFKKDILELISYLQTKKINFANFLYFKSEFDVLTAYLLLFLIKAFATKSKFKQHDHDFSSFSARELLFDRNDFINVFSDFLFKFFFLHEIRSKTRFLFSKENLRKFVFRFVDLCVKNELIMIRDVRVANRSYKLLSFTQFSIPSIPHIVFYTNEFNYYVRSETEFYAYNSHFSSVVEITKQAKYSNAHFKIPTEQVSALFERALYIDRDLLNVNFNYLLKDQKLHRDSNLLKESDFLSKKIEKFTIEEDLGSLQYYHSKMSKLLTLIRIKTVLSMSFDDTKLHLPFMFCFRGRIYELSDLSFTFYKEFRFCMYSGLYDKEEEVFHPISAHILITLRKQFSLLENLEWFSQLAEIRKFACV
jgi:hypothetical protein